MWNLSSIKSEAEQEPNRRSVFRLMAVENLLVGAEASTPSMARGVVAAIRRQRARTSPGSILMDEYDDAIAFVFKHPEKQVNARFSRATPVKGTLYCAFELHAALSEKAFHHQKFLREQGGDLSASVPATQIGFDLAPMRIVDVRKPPFDTYSCFTDPSTDYTECQAFADSVRQANAAAGDDDDAKITGIVFQSVRDIRKGTNIAVLHERGLQDRWRDGRRIKDWHVSVQGMDGPVVMQRSSGELHHFKFDKAGRPV